MDNEGDDPYKEGLLAIDPGYVIVSAPTSKESKYGHPHADAMKLYKEHCGEEAVLHTGAQRYCFITNIYDDGTYSGIQDDQGELVDTYGLSEDDDDDSNGDASKAAITAVPAAYGRTRVDDRPMGAR